MFFQESFDFRASQLAHGFRLGRAFNQVPEPSLIHAWAEVEHLWIIPAEKLAQLIAGANLLLHDVLFRARQFSDANHLRLIQLDAVKQMSIRSQRVAQNESIPAVIFGSGYGMTISKAIHLLRVDGKYCKLPLHQRFD